MRKLLLILCLPVGLAACGAESVWAPDEDVARATFSPKGEPTALTLFTVISNSSGSGGHTALMINGSQRVIFDPAGTWHHPSLPERNDVHFGITSAAIANYEDYHARPTFHVVVQTLEVSPEVAQQALTLAMGYGPVSKSMCSNAVSDILRQVDGLEDIGQSWFPLKTMEAFGAREGVEVYTVYDDTIEPRTDAVRVDGVSPRSN
jgi:hypothetical protein